MEQYVDLQRGDTVTIAGVEVKLLKVAGGQAKLGLEIPEGVTAYREEIWKRMQAEKRVAASHHRPVRAARSVSPTCTNPPTEDRR